MEVQLRKQELRSLVQHRLEAMSDEEITLKSSMLTARLLQLPLLQECRGVSVYVSMPKEVQTRAILERLFDAGKRVFVPKIVGRAAEDMRMHEVYSIQQIESFPRNKWNIPEPPKAVVLAAEDPVSTGAIDLVIMPGVAFDYRCGRVGHGKGYYGMCGAWKQLR
jgi:5-formyltetrahydrofolate cyclo-ligase